MNKLIREPLIHFLLLGGLLFALYSFLNKDEVDPEDYTIHITQSDVDRLVKAYQKNWNSLPDSTTLAAIIEDEIKTELLYREALRMNLDHNDEIIRRRLKQKYEFLVKDLVSLDQPSDKVLQNFYQEHAHLYQRPTAISFNQIYFSPDQRKDPQQDAQALLTQVPNQKISASLEQYGDNFHLSNRFVRNDKESVRQAFGKQFADALFQLNQQGWVPPIQSGYGYHLVYIDTILPPQALSFDQVKERIGHDWQQQQQVQYNKRLFENLRSQYKIEYADDYLQ